MKIVETLIKKYDAEHPTITRQENGVVITIDGAERESLLRGWAENAVQRGFETLRNQRNALLASCDWTQTADAPVDVNAWAAYRQALRDLPATIKDPTKPIDWPEPPK